MLKKHYIVVILLVVAAIAASIFLMPKDQQVALMQMKDKHFEEARAAYEAQLAEGNLNIEVVAKLAELYLQIGAVDKAIEVMEKFIADHPDNLEARNRLGTYYQYAQRQDDYLRNLEEINKLKPDPNNLKTMSEIYNFNTQYDKQAETLEKLVEKQNDAPAENAEKTAQYYLDLAHIQASGKSYAEAIETLRSLKKLHPEAFVFSHEELMVSLLFDDKRPEEAAAEANEWVTAHTEMEENARLVNMLHFRGNPTLARALMAHFSEEQINKSPALLEEHILLLLADGKDDDAYNYLKSLYDTNSLSPELHTRFLFLAVLRGESELAQTLIEKTELKAMNEPQVISLTELSITQREPWLLERITRTFPAESYGETFPILTAILGVANQWKNTDTLLNGLDKVPLTSSQSLQIARVCAAYKRFDCTEEFLKKLPGTNDLSDAEVANIGDLYIDMRQWDKGYAYITDVIKTRNSLEINRVAIKYAAVRGETDTVEKWLKAHPDASTRTVADLYFSALNYKKLETALVVAEFYHAKQNSALSRSYLSQAYVQTGQYNDALKLLRENNPMSEDDENNYLVALSKLAPKNADARKELTDFAQARLRSDIPKKKKLALVYALVNAKQIDVAMPYIRELALSEGGEWAALYATQLDKQGKYEEARSFWVAYANRASTSAKQKREIAYTLLDRGYKDDAQSLFEVLASKASADSQSVKELLYIWGPRPDNSKMSWIEKRYETASVSDKDGWATIISETATSEYILDFVSRHPDSANNPKLIRGYLQALIADGSFAAKQDDMIANAQSTGNVAWLKAYGQAARENGLNNEARKAFDTVVALDPRDRKSLREAGLIAFGQADYSASEMYLESYMRGKDSDKTIDDGEYLANFHYAELLRRKKLTEGAKPYYIAASDSVTQRNLTSAEALSVQAQSRLWAGDVDSGMQAFEAARTRYPTNDILRADQISSLIELKRYDEARALLAMPLSNQMNKELNSVSLPNVGADVKSYSLLSGNSELLVRFTRTGKQQLSADTFKAVPWVNYANEGLDTLHVVAKPGYALQLDTTSGATMLRGSIDNASGVYQDTSQTSLRYELLAARIDLETGHVYDAASRLNSLLPDHKNDPQLLGFIANAENFGGNWPRATQLLKTARQISPQNEDLARLERDIRRLNAQGVKLDHEWVKRGNDRENITTLSGMIDATDQLQLGIELQNDHVQAKNIRRADGRIGNFNDNAQRGELYVRYHGENGVQAKASLYGNNDTAGVGGTINFLNILGETAITAELHRPYWDFIEGVLDDATRDRIGLIHTIKPTPRLTISGGPGFNRYNVDSKNNVMSATSVDFDVAYQLINEDAYYIGLGYSLDAEYESSAKKGFDSLGNFSRLFPLRTREIHFMSINGGYNFSEDTYGTMLVGWGWDRFGGNGPTIEGRLTHEFDAHFDAQIRALYGLDNSSSNDNVARIGGYVRYRF